MQFTWNSNTEHGVPWRTVAQLALDTEQNPPHKQGSTTKPPAVSKLEKHLESLHNVEKSRRGRRSMPLPYPDTGVAACILNQQTWSWKGIPRHRFQRTRHGAQITAFSNSYHVCDIMGVTKWCVCVCEWEREREVCGSLGTSAYTATCACLEFIQIKLKRHYIKINYMKLQRFTHITN